MGWNHQLVNDDKPCLETAGSHDETLGMFRARCKRSWEELPVFSYRGFEAASIWHLLVRESIHVAIINFSLFSLTRRCDLDSIPWDEHHHEKPSFGDLFFFLFLITQQANLSPWSSSHSMWGSVFGFPNSSTQVLVGGRFTTSSNWTTCSCSSTAFHVLFNLLAK